MTESSSTSNKRIAKNTFFLYFRLVFTLLLGLYTSRLVLDVLGVVDYGIYNIVGGVVAIFAFLHGSLSGATTRFLNVSMVEDVKKMKAVFNTALIMHFILAVFVLILAETIGLWLLYNKLSIPANRFDISLVVYQLSVISIMVSIIQIPYDAAIIAHEKMNVYAYLSILDAILKLAVIFIVKYLNYDNLLFYAILILVVSILTRLISQIYCRRNFLETRFSFLFNKQIFKKMSVFFGWDLYGNMSVVLRMQGVNILQNIFFGPIVNASVAIVNQAQGGLMALGGNFTLALKPQIIQSYSRKDYNRMYSLLCQGTRLVFFLTLVVSLPIVFHTKYILGLWLNEVPLYADVFLKLSLLSTIIAISFSLLNIIIHATGRMFGISFITGSVYLFSLPIVYYFFKMGYNPTAPYYLNFFVVILTGIVNLYLVQKYIPYFKVKIFFKDVLLRLYLIFFMSLLIGFTLTKYLLIHPLVIMLMISVGAILSFILIGLRKGELIFIVNVIKENLNKI